MQYKVVGIGGLEPNPGRVGHMAGVALDGVTLDGIAQGCFPTCAFDRTCVPIHLFYVFFHCPLSKIRSKIKSRSAESQVHSWKAS